MYEVDQAIKEMQTVLSMWEFMAKRTPFNEENGANAWNEEEARHTYGTYIDEDGEEQVILSAAEESVVKLINAARESCERFDREQNRWHMERDSARRRIEELEKFAGMSDRELGTYFEEHLRRAKEDEGEETLMYVPDFYWHIARRLK